jgi:hypothetical protein
LDSPFHSLKRSRHIGREFPMYCYYCDTSPFGNVDAYEIHVVTRHPGLPGYPGPADLKSLRLNPQHMPWERQITEAEALDALRHYVNKRGKR